MSTLETNSIGKYSGNNVSIDDALNLKSYDTAGRDALTSVAGDLIYNSDDSKVQVYNGSSWDDLGGLAAFQISYFIASGGGAGGGTNGAYGYSGGGGAGGVIANYSSENSGGGVTEQPLYIQTGVAYAVSIGAGATGRSGQFSGGALGTSSYFHSVMPTGGGGGGSGYNPQPMLGGSGGGGGLENTVTGGGTAYPGLARQGFAGGRAAFNYTGNTTNSSGGGGGAGGVGGDGSGATGGNGGAGLATTISGSSATYAGGGAGAGGSAGGTGGTGGGANGVTGNNDGNNGTANTGGGGSGAAANAAGGQAGGNGGSGIIILRYPDTYTISQTGLTLTTATDGSDKVTTITAGTGTVSWS